MSRYRQHLPRLGGLGVAAALLVGGALGPPIGGVDGTVRTVLTVFAATLVLWITKPVPYAVSSVLCVALLHALGTVPTFADAASGFASTLVFFFVVLLLVGRSVANVGLDDWVAARLVAARDTPRRSVRRLSVMVLLLAFVLPSGLARGVTFMPIIDRINASFGAPADSQFRRLAYYLIGHLNPMASLALMTGGSMAVATAELVNASVRPLTWVEWALYMAPPTVLLFASCTVLGARYYDVPGDAPAGAAAGADTDPEGDDPTLEALGRNQKLVLGGLGGAIVMWVVGSFVGIPTLVPAVLIVVLFSLPGVGVLDASDVRAINWGIVFLVGAMLSLLDVMRAVGAFDLVVEAFGAVVPSGAPDFVVVAVVFAVAVLVRGTFSSVSASFVVLFPVVLEGLSTTDVTPLYVSFGLTTILMAATFLPFNNPAVLVAYDRGPLDATDVFRLGLLTLAVAVGVVVLSWTVYWPFVDRAVAI